MSPSPLPNKQQQNKEEKKKKKVKSKLQASKTVHKLVFPWFFKHVSLYKKKKKKSLLWLVFYFV